MNIWPFKSAHVAARAATPERTYEFVPGDEMRITPTCTIKRIRAIAPIVPMAVRPGDLGGYVESYDNLTGDAWVGGNAQVWGNAQISGNAWIYGEAQISGNVKVTNWAHVSGRARVHGDACIEGPAVRIHGDAHISGDGDFGAWIHSDNLIFWATMVGAESRTMTVYNTKNNGIGVVMGCFSGTLDEFRATMPKRTSVYREELTALVNVAVARIERLRYTVDRCKTMWDAIDTGNTKPFP